MHRSRGAILLYTLIILSVVMLISLAALSAALTLFGATEQSAFAEKSMWIAEAGLADITHRVKRNAVSPWDHRGERIEFGGGSYSLAIVPGERYLFRSEGNYHGVRSLRTNSFRIHYFSDHAIAVRGPYAVEDGQSNAAFPILVDGPVTMRPATMQYYLKSENAHAPLITLTGTLSVLAPSNSPVRCVAFGYRGPMTVYPSLEHTTAGDFSAGHARMIDMRFPSLAAVIERAAEHALIEHVGETNIVNPFLMEKEFLAAVGSGSMYLLDRALPPYAHIYIVPSSSRSNRTIDPYRYDDALNTEASYSIDGKRLIWHDISKRYRVLVNDASLARMNEFPLASAGYNNCSEARTIREVYADGAMLMKDGYTIRGRAIVLTKPLPGMFSAGYADGRKTRFRIPHPNAAMVFSAGIRVRDVYCDRGEIVFSRPPAYGERIDCYERIPVIEITKDMPSSSCDLFTDSSVRAWSISLNRLTGDKYRTDAPIFISGETKQRTSIVSSGDVYIGSISASRYPLAIYARTVFLCTPLVENVFIFTEAPNVYSLSGANARVEGCMVISRRTTAFTFENRDLTARIIDEGIRIPAARTSELLLREKEPLFFIE